MSLTRNNQPLAPGVTLQNGVPQIVFCHCVHAHLIPAREKDTLLIALRSSDHPIWEVADLCELAAHKDKRLADLVSQYGAGIHVMACAPRAVHALLAQAGTGQPAAPSTGHPHSADTHPYSPAVLGEYPLAHCHDLRVQNTAQILAAMGIKYQASEPVETVPPPVAESTWLPWFPVIDRDACTNCMQCLSFCLFGVFGISSERQIQVENPEKCKPNCPACARVCPEMAILFPKHPKAPINGAIETGQARPNPIKVDISTLLGGDLYQTLRTRTASKTARFSKERDPDKAMQERQLCLMELIQSGDIPEEVLKALPSPEEIQRRAAEAQARRIAAQKPSQST